MRDQLELRRFRYMAQVRMRATGFGSHSELLNAFLEMTFFAQAPEHPGFLATPTPSGPVIAVFTSQQGLALHAGACRWFSTIGADLLQLVPIGHRFVIDPGTAGQLVLDPAKIETRLALGCAG